MSEKKVSVEFVDDVALICIDNPPVNASGIAVRQGLVDALKEIDATGSAKAIGLYCAGRTFVAGADITEFGKPPMAPGLPEVCDILEANETPIVAAIHGTALGGGLETAMGCHARVAVPSAKVGLPEVLLGILPGAGGTQRAPRLAGIPSALDLILSGRHVPATEAHAMGLIDRIEEGEPREIALTAARDVVRGELATRRTCDLTTTPDEAAIEATAAMVAKKHPHLISPQKCVEAVAASTGDFKEGLALERAAFMTCVTSPQSKGLIHAFFGERAVANIPEKKAQARDVAAIGVIGGGTMGSGISTSALMAGLPVTLVEVTQEALDKGVATITANLDGAVKRGKMSAEKRDAALAMLTASTTLESLGDVDLVIEAVFENMEVKKEIFGKLDDICKEGAILASNTSYLDINEIAAQTRRPSDVLGLHFFSPAHIMKLLEVVVGENTAPEVVATGFALAKRMRKVGVRAGVCDGFIGNRILGHYLKAASYLVLDGAHPDQVDKALEGFGFAMGPHRVGDLAGLDIGYMTRKRLAATRPAEERYGGAIADRLSENGWNGRKTGKGYFVYEGRETLENPDLNSIIEEERAKAGITPRSFSDAEIVERYMTAMISEAVRVVADGIALRPVDVDVVFLMGYGFPRFRGGPLHYADTIGAAELVKRIEAYAAEDAHYWQVPALLKQMAADGTTFADLNKGK
ncbi:3-hydroxyacyl-CoA dehydrogenase NAD-binding domain-containing protein [Shimia sp. MMG029]|uniref:3-hydroxyacyl-CoA dehydrogenase NAD-binding domain-containing protein n=1 Tax=Shimia sp. MMG029 TaxID=3021978 RepID=UPI0022FE71D8|nr:3-hydroxyacyl-CoA dehydrogenase NAD-binding domain-containing protein [Shimia sp. MMG029]MDA5558054.1 3-hydroxyacyl-CoA dehydrogenase NAD-binding domain-containing protein [Shimia sp. MMG029]